MMQLIMHLMVILQQHGMLIKFIHPFKFNIKILFMNKIYMVKIIVALCASLGAWSLIDLTIVDMPLWKYFIIEFILAFNVKIFTKMFPEKT